MRTKARVALLLAALVVVGGGGAWIGMRELGPLSPATRHDRPSRHGVSTSPTGPIEVISDVRDALPASPVGTAVGIEPGIGDHTSILTATGHWYRAQGAVGLSPNGRYLVTDSGRSLVIRDLSGTRSPEYFAGTGPRPRLLGWSSNSRWALFSDLDQGGRERAVRIDLATGAQVSFDYDQLPALTDANGIYTLPYPLTGAVRQDGTLVLVRRGPIPPLPDDGPHPGPLDVFTVDPVTGSTGHFRLDEAVRWSRVQPGSGSPAPVEPLDAPYAWLAGHDDQLVLRLASRIVRYDSDNALGTTAVYDLRGGRHLRDLAAADDFRIASGGATLTCTTVGKQVQTVVRLDPTTGRTTRLEQFAWAPHSETDSPTTPPGTHTGPQLQLPGDPGNTL